MARELGQDPTRDEIAKGVAAGVEKMMFYGGAEKGDSTMLDSLIPMSEALSSGGNWSDVLAAAKTGCEGTKGMTASAGRASYVPSDSQAGVADPGATAIVKIIEALVSDCSNDS